MKGVRLAAAMVAAHALSAAAQEADGPGREGAGAGASFAITNARVHTVSGPVLEPATVVVRDGRVAAVGQGIAVPAGVRVLDAAGKVVTPGLLDSQTHLGAVEIEQIDATSDFASEDDRITAALRIADGINPYSPLIPVTRVEGITRAAVSPEPGVSLIAGQGALLDLSGPPLEAALTRSPTAVYASLGETGAALAGGSRGGAMLQLREVLQDALDFAVNREAFEANQRREYAVSRLDLEALVAVVRGQLPLAVTAQRASDLLAALRLAREFDLRLVLLGAAEGWLVAGEIARAGVPVVLNPLQNVPGFESAGATLENAARMHAAGVTLAFGSFESHNARTLKQGVGNAISYGLPAEVALRAVTLAPARIWGVAERYGSIEPGKDADLVVWSGDPFELSTRVEHVFIRGREMPLRTRQTELLEHYRRLPARPNARPGQALPAPAGGGAAPGPAPQAAPDPAAPAGEPRPPGEGPGVEPGPGALPEPPGEPDTPPAPPAAPDAPPPGEGPGTPPPESPTPGRAEG
ncbi:MAG: amidohydrolase family protein [Gemmatimonadota bacterium]